MGFMSRNLPAPRMMVSKMNQLRRTRYEEAMLNLQVSQQQKKPMMMMTMTMNDSSADSPAMAILDYSRVPAHLRHFPPRIVKRRLHLQQQSRHGMLLHQNPCLEGADLRSSNAKPERSDDEHKDMAELQTLVTYDETTRTMSSKEEEMEQEQKSMEKKKMMMMIEELRYHEAAGTPPASLFYTEYLQFDGHTILPNEVVAILPATLDDEDKTLVAVLR